VCTSHILSFCVSYGEQVIIQFLHTERVHLVQIHIRVEAQSGLQSYSLRRAQYRCLPFDCQHQNLSDAPRSGRPAIGHLNAITFACLERELLSSSCLLAEGLHVLLAIVLHRLRNSPIMKICSSPLDSTPADRHASSEDRKVPRTSSRPKGHAASLFHQIVTCDESWPSLE
jgi:hypothetical protein